MFLTVVHTETWFLLCMVVFILQPWKLTSASSNRVFPSHFVDPSVNINILDDHDNHHEVISCSPSEGGECSRSSSSSAAAAAEININGRYDLIEHKWTAGGIDHSNHSKCSYSNSSVGYHCYCEEGYTGDPYDPQGCHDVDECTLPEKYPCKGVCENTPGSYTCSCPPGTHGDSRFFCERDHKGSVATILKSMGVFITILIIAMLIIIYSKKRMKFKNFMKNGGAMLKNQINIFTESEIIKATENYKHQLGRGAFGSVFKGELATGREIAVKKANGFVPRGMNETQIDQQFQREICAISLVNHKNVVKLLGLCLESKFPMLVYEYVSNGTVFEHIHNNRSSNFKCWKNCLKIAAETACALNYLHSLADPPIIHRDVKSMNILLDSKLTAKVSDFGTSVFIPPDQSGVATTVQGTLGYLDPEYLTTRILTAKSDVFSFGVVLIELLTGWNPVPNGDAERNIIRQFIAMVEADNLSQNLNVEPADDGELEQIKEVAKLAVKCLNGNRTERPTMKDVAEELDKQMRILNGNSNSQSANISQELGAVHVPDNKQPSAISERNPSIQMAQFENKVKTGFGVQIGRSRSRSRSM